MLNELQALYDREQRIEIEYPDHRKETLPHLVRFVGRGLSATPGWMGPIPPAWCASRSIISAG